jgi:hypothetical protein
MAAETQYTANTGVVTIATANTALDGTGTLGTLLTGASNGTLVKQIIFKAQVTTTEGILRVFVTIGANTRLLQEIEVPAVTPSSTDPSFEYVWQCNYTLVAGAILKVSTVKAESFNVIAEGLNWAYYAASIRPESANYTANTGMDLMTVANTTRNGTGTLYNVITAGLPATYKGCRVDDVILQAIVNTTRGMIRLYIFNGTTAFLFTEVFTPYVTKSNTAKAFQVKIPINFELQCNFSIKASTNNAESCVVIGLGNDWKYPA